MVLPEVFKNQSAGSISVFRAHPVCRYVMDYRQKFEMKQKNAARRDLNMDNSFSLRQSKQRSDEEMNRLNRLERRRSIPVTVFSWTFQILLVIMFAYMAVYFFGQARTNVGQSMDTTLSGGDVVLLNVLAYQMSGPERGDIIAFKPNGSDSSRSSIKRVVGLPGETVQIMDGMIYIDGKTYLEQKSFPAITNPGMAAEPIKLSATEYFVLGDNRNNSEDSRFADVGKVTTDMIEGKVWFVLSPASRRGLLRK